MSAPDLDSPAFFAEPTATLDALRSTAPVYFHAAWDAYVLTRYDDVVRVIRDPSFSVARGGAIGRSADPAVAEALAEANRFFGLWMVFSDPPRHGRLRQRLGSAFTPARMRGFTRAIDDFLDRRLGELVRRGEPFDLIREVADPLPARMTSVILGLPEGAESSLHALTDDFFALFGSTDAPAEVVVNAHRAVGDARAFFEDVVARRRREPGDDLLSHVIAAEMDEPTLTEDELVGLAMTLVAGAYGTTTHLIGHAVLHALRNPEVYAALVADPEIAPGLVEETFRVDGPALAIVRQSTRPFELSGTAIPAGARLYCMLHAANHDPEVFDAPGRFDPSRSPNKHLGLGAGPHFCLGASLTRLEATRALVALAAHMPDLTLVREPPRNGNLSMRGLDRLEVSPTAPATSAGRRPPNPPESGDRPPTAEERTR